jgi:hypothetical protein
MRWPTDSRSGPESLLQDDGAGVALALALADRLADVGLHGKLVGAGVLLLGG